MVTTRRSSFGVQDGDTLALRSKSTSGSTETTPTRKRKEYAVGVRSSSRKKRKPFGSDGADDAPVEPQEIESTPRQSAKPFDEPASKPADEENTDAAVGQPIGTKGEPGTSTSWLEDDFIPFSTGILASVANAEKASEVKSPATQTSVPDDNPNTGLDLDAENMSKMDGSEKEILTDQDIQDASLELRQDASQQPSRHTSAPNVHKRFSSEEPELIEEENAATGPQENELDLDVENGAGDADGSSDDDAPEVVGSKSVAKDSRPPFKAPKKTKRKAKPKSAVSAQANTTETDHAAKEEDPFFVDLLPKEISKESPELSLSVPEPPRSQPRTTSSRQPSKKRKLLDESEKKPKDAVKDGVTYRTVSKEGPGVLASKRHRASHLPPKSSVSNWRLKKQVLGRKRVQHVWGGRSTFLRA